MVDLLADTSSALRPLQAHLAAHSPRGGGIDLVAYLVILRIYPLDRDAQTRFKDGQLVSEGGRYGKREQPKRQDSLAIFPCTLWL